MIVSNPYDIQLFDIDGDQDFDVAFASYNTSGSIVDVGWVENLSGDGSNWILRNLSVQDGGAVSIEAGDVDGDLDTDLVSALYLDDKIVWYECERPIPVPDAIWQADLPDSDPDNDIDFADVAAPFYVHFGKNVPNSAYNVYRDKDSSGYALIPCPLMGKSTSIQGATSFAPWGEAHWEGSTRLVWSLRENGCNWTLHYIPPRLLRRRLFRLSRE
ncbi:MAG: hypothetical protein KC964_14650 [Candidatus Omnitrophica bacterium]|nr:hypothetical protein [Candidatus Omnitrophota bacterium]